MSQNSLDLVQGTVDVLILGTLAQGPRHGYGVSRWIRERTDGRLGLDDAALYQALHRMEEKGWVRSEWGLSDNNRRAKFYELTEAGRRRLDEEINRWRTYSAAMDRVLDAVEAAADA